MLREATVDQRWVCPDPWVYIDEITHRTVNDYTAMLVSVQYAARTVSDASARSALDEVASRLHASALTHRLLRPPRGTGMRRLDTDLEELCAALSASLLADRAIELTLFCDPTLMNGRRAWQACLIVSELVMNAVRHAFVFDEGGSIFVEVRPEGHLLHCLVSDNGRGSAAPSSGGGSVVVDALVTDLGGQVSRNFTSSGSRIRVTLPLDADSQAGVTGIP